jgi:putative ABC transport system permease protein
MVAATAVGIGVSMTMITVYYLMAQNPIPQKSDQLYRVQVDSWGPLRPFDRDRPERAPIQLTYRDAVAFVESAPATRHTAMFETGLVVEPSNPDQLPFEVGARATYSDFFEMFDVPFLYGGPWDRIGDKQQSQTVVLTKETNIKLFGGEDSVGQKVRLNSRDFTVSGVLDTWEPMPRFYDIVNGPMNVVNDVFIPFTLTPSMELQSWGSDFGWKSEDIKTFDDWLNSESAWIQYWAELESPEEAAEYLAYLDSYVMEQKKLGRFQRPVNNYIHSVTEWLDYNEVVQPEVKVLVGIGLLFLLVCLLSTISLLLTKFTSRAAEVSLRRALGATRLTILSQQLVEILVIGVIGGAIGVGLTKLSLLGMKNSVDMAPDVLFRMNWTLIGMAILTSAAASLIAGLYPAWRVCLIEPAQELNSQ